MKLTNATHTDRPWRIQEITPDFRLYDVWALPTPGGPDDIPNGLCGRAYIAAIAPFRHLVVYPPLIRGIGQAWPAGAGEADGVRSRPKSGLQPVPRSGFIVES